MNSVSDLYHIVEKDGDYKEIHLRRMGSQLEQVRLDTSSARERSEDLADEVHSITQVMANAKRRGTWGRIPAGIHRTDVSWGQSVFVQSRSTI